MPQKREARELSEFFKFRSIGQAVAGQVDTFGKSGTYDTWFMVLSPVLIKQSKDGPARKFGSVAIGLSADLISKINMKRDAGRFLSVEFVSLEPSPKGSDKRIFEVNELTSEEFSRLEAKATDETFARNSYKRERDDDIPPNALDGDDDLPF